MTHGRKNVRLIGVVFLSQCSFSFQFCILGAVSFLKKIQTQSFIYAIAIYYMMALNLSVEAVFFVPILYFGCSFIPKKIQTQSFIYAIAIYYMTALNLSVEVMNKIDAH